MSRRLRWTLIAAIAAFSSSVAAMAQAESTEAVAVSVQAETLSISVAGGEVALGGPWGSNVALQAHPQQSIRDSLPPTITNNGNVEITSLVVSYTSEVGQEGSCDSGAGTWAAHATTTGADRFVMRAWASTNPSFSAFPDSASPIAPETGTGNILHSVDTPLVASAAVPLLLELVTPSPALHGSTGCTIGLSVTASAAS